MPSSIPALVLLFVASFAVLRGTAHAQGADTPRNGPVERLRVAPVDPEWFNLQWVPPAHRAAAFAHEARLANAHPGDILRWANLLALRLKNGLFVWLVDMGDDSVSGFNCCEVHRLEAYWPALGFYLVDVNQTETGYRLLISDRTADMTRVVGPVYPDPATPGLFVSVLASDMEGYRAEIWKLEGTSWQRRYACAQLTYPTDFLRWEAPRRAVLGFRDSDTGVLREFTLAEHDSQWRTDACEEGEAALRR